MTTEEFEVLLQEFLQNHYPNPPDYNENHALLAILGALLRVEALMERAVHELETPGQGHGQGGNN